MLKVLLNEKSVDLTELGKQRMIGLLCAVLKAMGYICYAYSVLINLLYQIL
jgi:hypothetical protein